MIQLSTGHPSTLGSYRDLCKAVFGETSAPTQFFDEKIKESPNGRFEEVIVPESQMMYLISELYRNDTK